MKLYLRIKELIIFSIIFIVFTVIGTISHEYGHILVAKHLGYRTTLHYASMGWNSDLQVEQIKIYRKNKLAIKNKTYFKQKEKFEKITKVLSSNSLLITMGGPFQTILTGIIGLIFLIIRKKLKKGSRLNIIDWIAVFLSLFWLREVFNLVMSISSEFISPNGSYFGGDEKRISIKLDLWQGTVPICLGVIGLIISLIVIFRIVPTKYRQTFILSGLVGGTLGYILWIDLLGPILLP